MKVVLDPRALGDTAYREWERILKKQYFVCQMGLSLTECGLHCSKSADESAERETQKDTPAERGARKEREGEKKGGGTGGAKKKEREKN